MKIRAPVWKTPTSATTLDFENISIKSRIVLTGEVLTWVDIWCIFKKKKTHIPCHYKSSISHPHSLFVSVSPTHCLFLTSHPLPTPLNLFQSYFQSFSLGLFYHSLSLCIAPLSCLFSRYTVVYKGGARGVWGYQSCYKTFFVEVGAVSFAFKWIGAGKRGGKKGNKMAKNRDWCIIY